MQYRILRGDCVASMRAMPDNFYDSIVCDPPYELGFMGKTWDASGIAYSVEMWREALRVLKPGGHLLAFSGSRTYHRMTCAIEDAGFEIRDQIMWVYGSGFPKSLDVSKALEAFEKTGRSDSQVTGDGRSRVPGQHYKDFRKGNGPKAEFTPTTDAARQWEGWGTALKPAHEPICVARKPLASLETNVLHMVESQLRAHGVRGEIKWKAESASGAAKSKRQPNSSSIQPQPAAATSAASVGASVTPSAAPRTLTPSQQLGSDGPSATLAESSSTADKVASGYGLPFSQPTAENANAVASLNATFSPSTTSTAAELHTDERSTEKSTHSFGATDSRPAIASYAGIATGLPGSMATVHIMQDADGLFVWPKGLPKKVLGGPLTVAANVLAHGTGALNIDGCRVPGEPVPMFGTKGGRKFDIKEHAQQVQQIGTNDAGRWPANLIHDGSDEVLALFPESTSAARFFYCAKASRTDRNEGLPDPGPQFQHGTTLRQVENTAARGNNHPTVKPTALMQYLVRLVTPPGGHVLDPFAGSGSTGKACAREGFHFTGCELSDEYADIAEARIDHELYGDIV